ncbi:MAG: CDGSH-type Zn-finger protein [Chitinophagales bacterium]|jgi:CDGSH-type Zn-finger protein
MEKKTETKVEVKANGPLIISGHFTVTLSNGESKTMERLVICRCGESGNMPFCDASHNRVGFQAD